MAEPNELANPLLRTVAIVDVLRRMALQESYAGNEIANGRPQSLGYLMVTLETASRLLGDAYAVVRNADTEANWRDLRELGVELSALSLRALQTIDRQKSGGKVMEGVA